MSSNSSFNCFSLSLCLSCLCSSVSSISHVVCFLDLHSSLHCSSLANALSNNTLFLFFFSLNFLSSASCFLQKSSLILLSEVVVSSPLLLTSLINCSSTLCIFCCLFSINSSLLCVLFVWVTNTPVAPCTHCSF